MDEKELERRGEVVADAIGLVHDATNLADVARSLKVLIDHDYWRDFIVPETGERIKYTAQEWDKFVRTPPTRGLGANQKLIEELGAHHSQELAERIKTLRHHGMPPTPAHGEIGRGRNRVDISTLSTKELGGGTSKAYRIARLKRDAPDIAERVINNEISAAAGIRELRKRNGEPEYKRRAVNMVDAQSAFKTITKNMEPDTLDGLIDLLIEWRNTELD